MLSLWVMEIKGNLLLWSLILTYLRIIFGLPAELKIGGIFDQEGPELAFKLAVDYVNQNKIISESTHLSYLLNTTKFVSAADSIQLACIYASQGISAFIGPLSSTATKTVSGVSKALNIPQCAPIATNPRLSNNEAFTWLIRMMAPDSVQSLAISDLVKYFKWTKMAILTSDTDYGVNGLIQFQTEAAKEDWRIVSVMKFSTSNNASETNATKELLVIKQTRVRVVILNCLESFGLKVLEQAAKLGMTDYGWAWIVTDGMTGHSSMDSPPSYMHGLLGTRPNFNHGALWDTYNEFIQKQQLSKNQIESLQSAYSAYTFDAVLTYAYAMRDLLNSSNATWSIQESSLSCEKYPPETWSYGPLLLDAWRKVSDFGVTNYLEFDQNAAPLHPAYDIVNMGPQGWKTVGNWTSQTGLFMDKDANITFHGGQSTVLDYIGHLANQTLRIVTLVEKPFIMLKNPQDRNNIQDDEIEGYCADLIHKLCELAGFNYTIYLVPDGNFGIKNRMTRKWNGLVRELVDRNADLALADLTISFAREQDIDFTKPFMDLGMRFILQAQKQEDFRPFGFLDPLATNVWTQILLTTFVVGIAVSLINKLSPNDYHGEFIYIDSPNKESRNFQEYKKYCRVRTHALNELNFANAFWFSVASLLQQGGETYPRSLPGRLITVAWWLATVILVATYTANLAAWLTKSRTSASITSVEDLGTQSKVSYGTVESSMIWQYFRDSEVILFAQMREAMIAAGSLISNTAEGIQKTREGDYAFIWDGPVLDYESQQKPCGTIQTVGRPIGQVGYGLGLQKNSPYNTELSTAILQLRESGFMDDLKAKWFIDKTECASSDDQSEHEKQIEAAGGQLDLENFLGVFYIMYGGLIFSFIVLVLEWVAKCLTSVDWMGVDPLMKPGTFAEAVKRRWRAIVHDFKEEWDIFCCRQEAHEIKERSDVYDLTALAKRMKEIRGNLVRECSSSNSAANLLESADGNSATGLDFRSQVSVDNSKKGSFEEDEGIGVQNYESWDEIICNSAEEEGSTYVYNGKMNLNQMNGIGQNTLSNGKSRMNITLPDLGPTKQGTLEEQLAITDYQEVHSLPDDHNAYVHESILYPHSYIKSRQNTLDTLHEICEAESDNDSNSGNLNCDEISLKTVNPSPSRSFNSSRGSVSPTNPYFLSSPQPNGLHLPLHYTNSLPSEGRFSPLHFYSEENVYHNFYQYK